MSTPPAACGDLLPPPAAGLPEAWTGRTLGTAIAMRFGNVEVRPLGGGLGCLAMLLFSLVASVLLTLLVNLLR